MSINKNTNLNGLKKRLNENYTWPSRFPFKFIVPVEQSNQVIELLDDNDIKIRYSSKGNYASFTSEKEVNSATEVINVYKIMEKIPGIISL